MLVLLDLSLVTCCWIIEAMKAFFPDGVPAMIGATAVDSFDPRR